MSISGLHRAKSSIVGVVVVALCAALVGCGKGPDNTYVVSAYFSRAISLYEGSAVRLMGTDVGEVSDIRIEDSRVRVEMRIRNEVPLSPDIKATINALTLIGERNVVLSPAWHRRSVRDIDNAPGLKLFKARREVDVDRYVRGFVNQRRVVWKHETWKTLGRDIPQYIAREVASWAVLVSRPRAFAQVVKEMVRYRSNKRATTRSQV